MGQKDTPSAADIVKGGLGVFGIGTQSNGPGRVPSVQLPNVRIPGIPDIKGGWDKAKGIVEGEPDYLVSYKKGKNGPETVYRGDVEKDGTIKFRAVEADELRRLKEKGQTPETFQQLKTNVAAGNTPASLTQSISRTQAANNILVHAGIGTVDKSIDHLPADLAKTGKGVDVSGNVSKGREELIQELEQRKKELDTYLDTKGAKGKKPDPNKDLPGQDEGVRITPNQLKTSINEEIKTLKEAQEPGKAVSAFDSQVVNPVAAPAATNPLDKPSAAPAVSTNPLDRAPSPAPK